MLPRIRITSATLAVLCTAALPNLALAQQHSDSTAIVATIISTFKSLEGVQRIALRSHDSHTEAFRVVLKALHDSTTVASAARLLPCPWPADSLPKGAGYDLVIRPVTIMADSAVVAVTSVCDSSPNASHITFASPENFYLKKAFEKWAIVKREPAE